MRDLNSERSEIVTLSWWSDTEAIKAFAGVDYARSRYFPEDDRFLLTRPEHVHHYEATVPGSARLFPALPAPRRARRRVRARPFRGHAWSRQSRPAMLVHITSRRPAGRCCGRRRCGSARRTPDGPGVRSTAVDAATLTGGSEREEIMMARAIVALGSDAPQADIGAA